MSDRPGPPVHLSAERAELWTAIIDRYSLDAAELALLETACVQLDRAAAARVQISEQGITTPGRYGERTNPAVLIERDATNTAARLFKALALPNTVAELHRAPDRVVRW